MNFDYTYIFLFGFKVFEPVVLLTNTIMFVLSVIYFSHLNKMSQAYSKQMGRFMLLLGLSTLLGGTGHAIHLQLGETVFSVILFLMNAFSLLSMYFCFRASYTYVSAGGEISRVYNYLVIAGIIIMLIVAGILENFLLIKILAGIVLVYALVTCYLVYKRTHDKGSARVLTGLLISFLPIIVHSMHLSIHEWFNYKDLAHVIMIISLIVLYNGVCKISETFPKMREATA